MKIKQTSVVPLWETVKFIIRMGLLVGLPIAVDAALNLQGIWGEFFQKVLPVALPIIDKWIHEDKRIPARGITPF